MATAAVTMVDQWLNVGPIGRPTRRPWSAPPPASADGAGRFRRAGQHRLADVSWEKVSAAAPTNACTVANTVNGACVMQTEFGGWTTAPAWGCRSRTATVAEHRDADPGHACGVKTPGTNVGVFTVDVTPRAARHHAFLDQRNLRLLSLIARVLLARDDFDGTLQRGYARSNAPPRHPRRPLAPLCKPKAPPDAGAAGQARRSGRAGPDPGRSAASQLQAKQAAARVAALLKDPLVKEDAALASQAWPVPQSRCPSHGPSTLPSGRPAIRRPRANRTNARIAEARANVGDPRAARRCWRRPRATDVDLRLAAVEALGRVRAKEAVPS